MPPVGEPLFKKRRPEDGATSASAWPHAAEGQRVSPLGLSFLASLLASRRRDARALLGGRGWQLHHAAAVLHHPAARALQVRSTRRPSKAAPRLHGGRGRARNTQGRALPHVLPSCSFQPNSLKTGPPKLGKRDKRAAKQAFDTIVARDAGTVSRSFPVFVACRVKQAPLLTLPGWRTLIEEVPVGPTQEIRDEVHALPYPDTVVRERGVCAGGGSRPPPLPSAPLTPRTLLFCRLLCRPIVSEDVY